MQTLTMRQIIKDVQELRRRKRFLQTRLEGLFLKAFKLADVNGDGGVSMDECVVLDKQIAQVTGNLGTFIDGDSRRMWREMDANGDGEVSEKEYTATQMKMVPAASHEAVGCVTFWCSGCISAPASFVTGVACAATCWRMR